MEFSILIGIIAILYWGFSQSRKAKSSSFDEKIRQLQSDFHQHMEVEEQSEEEKYREKLEKKKRKHAQKQAQKNKSVKGKAESVRPAKSAEPVPKTKSKLTAWQKAWIMKEIVDQPRALRPYRFRQPR